MLLPTPDTCLQFAAYILPLLLKALFINMVIIDLASVNQRNPCASEITVFFSNTTKLSAAVRRNCTILPRALPWSVIRRNTWRGNPQFFWPWVSSRLNWVYTNYRLLQLYLCFTALRGGNRALLRGQMEGRSKQAVELHSDALAL